MGHFAGRFQGKTALLPMCDLWKANYHLSIFCTSKWLVADATKNRICKFPSLMTETEHKRDLRVLASKALRCVLVDSLMLKSEREFVLEVID